MYERPAGLGSVAALTYRVSLSDGGSSAGCFYLLLTYAATGVGPMQGEGEGLKPQMAERWNSLTAEGKGWKQFCSWGTISPQTLIFQLTKGQREVSNYEHRHWVQTKQIFTHINDKCWQGHTFDWLSLHSSQMSKCQTWRIGRLSQGVLPLPFFIAIFSFCKFPGTTETQLQSVFIYLTQQAN